MKTHVPSAAALPLLLATLAGTSAGCHVSMGWGSNLVVDGVELEERHDEVLEVPSWGPEGLTVESAMGDVRVEAARADEPTSIRVVVHEKVPGDARAVLEGGRLFTRSASGDPSAVGDVVVRTGDLPRLAISTGLGDVELRDVAVEVVLTIETGKGDIAVVGAGAPERVVVATGLGDIELARLSCRELRAESGLGEVEARAVQGDSAKLSSGLGDVELEDCSFRALDASTGLGDVECVRTTYEVGDLESGLGSTSRR